VHTDPSSPPTERGLTRRSLRLLAAGLAITALAGCAPATTVPSATAPATTAPGSTTTSIADASTETSTPTGAAPSTDLLDRLLATRDDAGRMPVESALEAFAAVYGELPDVETPAGEAGTIEGTTAARWLAGHRDTLSAEQLAAVDRAMSPQALDGSPHTAEAPPSLARGLRGRAAPRAVRESTTGCFGGTFAFADAPGSEQYRDVVRLALAELRLLLGPLDIPVYTAFSSFEGVNADLNPWAPDCDQPAQACQIRLAPLALTMSTSTLVKTLAHELTHCYQARAVGATAIAELPDWLVEGFPSYVGETVGVSVGNTTPNYWWDKWFKSPGRPLFSRTYDALGFYAVVKQAGGDPFGRYLAALRTQDSSAAFQHLLGGAREQVGTTWGATHFRQIERGVFWDLDGPGATGYRPALPVSKVTNGGEYASAPGEAQAEADRFALEAEVVIVELSGPLAGRYSFTGTADEVLDAGHEWCTLGYPCVCPEGSPKSGHVVEQAPADELAIGVAGLERGGTLRVRGMSFEDYCGPASPEPPRPPAPPSTDPDVVDPCLVGSWVSDAWTLPGPAGTDLGLAGGAGISMTIDRGGAVTTDFGGMAPMTGTFTQTQSGTASQTIRASDGTVDERTTDMQMSLGPGVFAVWRDGTRYECGDDGSFTLVAFDEVEGVDVPITFQPAD
jgi:hypothetical protein